MKTKYKVMILIGSAIIIGFSLWNICHIGVTAHASTVYEYSVDNKTVVPVTDGVSLFYKDRRDYAYFKSARKGVTTYLGKRLSEGFTKLYDKKKESDLDYDLTRLEITFGDSDLPTMPDVYIDGGQTNLMVALSGTNRVLALLLNQLDETDFQTYYGMLNYKLRKKLEPHVKKGKKLEYDYKVIYELMMDIKKFEKEFNIDDDFHNLKFMNIESPFFNA